MTSIRTLTCLAAILFLAAPAAAQLQTGNLFGTVVDDQGGQQLPGVTVTLTGAAWLLRSR